MDLQYIKDKLSLLPMQPGCYLMKDKDGTVIYVGKAKKLKNFMKNQQGAVYMGYSTDLYL